MRAQFYLGSHRVLPSANFCQQAWPSLFSLLPRPHLVALYAGARVAL